MTTPQKEIKYYRFEFNKWDEKKSSTIVEFPVSLTVNSEAWVTFMCTPVNLEAMMVGFLYNEGVIQGIEEIADVRVCDHGDNVDVWLTHAAEQPTSWRRTSGCTGGITAVDLLSNPAIFFEKDGLILEPETIGLLVDRLFNSQKLYRDTGGVHTSALSDGEGVLLVAEDIGRHNTLDKIAGLCLTQSVWPEKRILISTGRISSEMLQKAARLGAPIIISRTSPSSLSIEMAERYGITLIGYARRQRFNVYSHAYRVNR
ncbi:MAG: formate dehydrogenase accessory sulfurtransferase FdhD [Chloroflexi bacterium]|nr:formate dehydrogenase accessory sulfurtransferase FdhD [Chloroflexota bacterium]